MQYPAVQSLQLHPVSLAYGLSVGTLAHRQRSRKKTKRGPKRLFNPEVYKLRFTSERTFAWMDKFRALLVRFDRKVAHFMGAHYLVYALINLRHLLAKEKFQ